VGWLSLNPLRLKLHRRSSFALVEIQQMLLLVP